MTRDYLDFDIAIEPGSDGQLTHVTWSPAGTGSAPFVLPFSAVDLAQFMNAVGPPRVTSRRLVPAEHVMNVKDYGQRLGSALLAGEIDTLFRSSLSMAKQQGRGLRVRLQLEEAPDLEPVPWEYLYDSELGRFLTLSSQTPIVRALDALDVPAPVAVTAPLRVLVMISSPTDVPELAVEREEQLLQATTGDLVKSGQLELVVLKDATLTGLQRALLDRFHVFHFIGHGGFDRTVGEGVLVLEREDGTAHRVGGSRLGTLLHDAQDLQLVVLNACEGARSSGRDAFSGVAQALVRQGLPAVVAMQTEISDRAALVFSHEFYYFLTRGLPIDAAMCEVRKAMAISDEASEWGTAVLIRSGSDQPFELTEAGHVAEPAREARWESLYQAAQASLGAGAPEAAVPILEQLAAEQPDYADVTQLLDRAKTASEPEPVPPDGHPRPVQPEVRTEPVQPARLESQPPAPERPDREVPRPPKPRRHLWRWVVGVLAFVVAAVTGLAILGFSEQTDACGPQAGIPSAGRQLLVGCTTTPPGIDGSFDDWASVPGTQVGAVVFPRNGQNTSGVHGVARMLWDRQALYVEAEVVDLNPRDVDESQPDQFWRGDAVSFEFGPDARTLGRDAGVRDGRDRHVIIGISAGQALGAMNVAAKGTFPSGGEVRDIDAEVARTAGGYRLEVRVPWSVLGVSDPKRGDVFAGNLNISDAKPDPDHWELGVMVSTNPQRTVQNRPALWQPIVLGDPA